MKGVVDAAIDGVVVVRAEVGVTVLVCIRTKTAGGTIVIVIEVGDVVNLGMTCGCRFYIIAELVHVGRESMLVLDADNLGNVIVIEVELGNLFAMGHGEGVEGGGGDKLPVEVGAADAVLMGVDLHVHIKGVARMERNLPSYSDNTLL